MPSFSDNMKADDDERCYSQFTAHVYNYEQMWRASAGLDDPENCSVFPVVVTDVDSFQRDQQQAESLTEWALGLLKRPEVLRDRAQAERAELEWVACGSP